MELEETGTKVQRELHAYGEWKTVEPTITMTIKAPKGICQIYGNTPQASKAIRAFMECHRED